MGNIALNNLSWSAQGDDNEEYDGVRPLPMSCIANWMLGFERTFIRRHTSNDDLDVNGTPNKVRTMGTPAGVVFMDAMY